MLSHIYYLLDLLEKNGRNKREGPPIGWLLFVLEYVHILQKLRLAVEL